jgi:hypothetical protein
LLPTGQDGALRRVSIAAYDVVQFRFPSSFGYVAWNGKMTVMNDGNQNDMY